jgi:hypothetical protein
LALWSAQIYMSYCIRSSPLRPSICPFTQPWCQILDVVGSQTCAR